MSYVILPHVATGDLATAALHNTLLDDVAIIKSNINDDGTLNPIRRITSTKGTFSGTTITTVSQVVLPTLTDADHLIVRWGMKLGTGVTTDGVQLRHVTDNAKLASLTSGVSFNAGEFFGGFAQINQDQNGNTKIDTFISSAGDAHPDGLITGGQHLAPYTATATWGSQWTLGLALTQTSGSTNWWWSVVLYPGQ